MTAPTPKKSRCGYISKIGSRCQADPQTGKEYCFFHDPEQKTKRAEARRLGGEARARQMEPQFTPPADLPDFRLSNSSEVLELLSLATDCFLRGELDLRTLKTLGYLLGLLIRALKVGNQQDAVELLVKTINRLERGEMNFPSAKALGYYASLMLNAGKLKIVEEQRAAQQAASSAYTAEPSIEMQEKKEKKEKQPSPAEILQIEKLEDAFQTVQGLIQNHAPENVALST